jgi:TRAP-type uncharacterized transport system substrate-binding protein
MLRTILTVSTATLVVIGGVAAAVLYLYNRPTELRVAVVQEGQDFRLMSAAAQVFSWRHEPVRLKVVPAADAAAVGAALEQGRADLAVVRSDALPPAAQALVVLRRNAALLVAPGGSGLRRVADLRGKKIGVVHDVSSAPTNMRLLETILAQYDIPQQSANLTPIAPDEAQSALQSRRVDAIFMVALPQIGPASEIVAQIAASNGKAPIFIPIAEAKAISKRFPALEPAEVVRGAFGGDPPRPDQPFDSATVAVLLVARPSLENIVAGEVTRQFLIDRTAIAIHAPLANNMEAPSTDKDSVVPAHQGAIDFLEGEERGFFDKYSDFFYLGAMLVSFVGSAAAALASRVNARTHEQSERVTERLLEILRAARGASSSSELDGYEHEVDQVLVESMADVRLRNMAPTELHMVALALDQARQAIQARRRALADDAIEGAVTPFRKIRLAE